MNNTFSDRLKMAMQSADVKQADLVRITGIDKSLISHYINGDYTAKQENIYALATALNVDSGWLLGFDTEVSDKGTFKIDNARYIETNDKLVKIPVLGRVPAGTPIEAVQDIICWEDISSSMLKNGQNYFGLKIVGDSMYPYYMDGDIIILKQTSDCNSGDDCVVMVNDDDATFKRISKQEDGIWLKPLNPAYEPRFFSWEKMEKEHVRILGVEIEMHRK